MGTDGRWLAWVQESMVVRTEEWIGRHGMQTTAHDLILSSPEKYASKMHHVPTGTGGPTDGPGYPDEDNSGRSACGVKVPPHGEESCRLWFKEDDAPQIEKCAKCKRIVDPEPEPEVAEEHIEEAEAGVDPTAGLDPGECRNRKRAAIAGGMMASVQDRIVEARRRLKQGDPDAADSVLEQAYEICQRGTFEYSDTAGTGRCQPEG